MTDPTVVCSSLEAEGIFPDLTAEELMPFCQRATRWLMVNLKDDADSDSFIAQRTAEAVARYYVFTGKIASTESCGNFKVGDMTIKRDIAKEYEIEKELYKNALCEAAEILKDGGFYFATS